MPTTSNLITRLSQTYNYTDADEHIRQYDPGVGVPYPDYIIEKIINISAKNRENAIHKTFDIPYGTGDRQILDFYAPSGDNTGYLMLFIHGGYWRAFSKNDFCCMVQNFQNNGVSLAVINYTLCPETTIAGIVNECRNAIAHLVNNHTKFGFDADKIIVSGHSAGGHLAVMMGVTDWHTYHIADPICGIISVGGLFDLIPLVRIPINEDLKLTPDTARTVSPMHLNTMPKCPVALVWAEREVDGFIKQNTAYAELLKHHNVPVTCTEIANKDHIDIVLDMGENETTLSDICFGFTQKKP